MMKVFLSSTVEALRDARLSLIERLERSCGNSIQLICYERDGHRQPALSPEDTCLALVRDSEAIILLLDQYYGSPSIAVPGISITHAEVRTALQTRLPVIPVIRTQTWHEFAVWRTNAGCPEIRYAHVKEPRVFEILSELYTVCNCHIYDHLTGDQALTEIAAALKAVIAEKAAGTIQHVTLPSESMKAVVAAGTSAVEIALPHFKEGQLLRAEDLNSLYAAVARAGEMVGCQIKPAVTWENGRVLLAPQLNLLLEDVAKIHRHSGRPQCKWSFGKFQSGEVLRASHINEIVEALEPFMKVNT